jgi:hypothetical protein
MRVVSLRVKRSYLHALYGEMAHEILNLAISIAQLVACFGFYTTATAKEYDAACWNFFVTSMVNTMLSAVAAHEAYRFDGMTEVKRVAHERELIETSLAVIGNMMFAIGSILFLPAVYEHDERNDLTAGTALFLAGSLLFGIGSFFNVLGLLSVKALEHEPITFHVGVFSILLVTLGCYAFVSGSYFYFPQLEPESDGGTDCGVTQTWNNIDFGTHQYVVGSSCFLASALLNLVNSLLKRRLDAKVHTNPKPAA